MKRPKHYARKAVLATVVASMAVASPAWAAVTTIPSTSVLKTSFPDVAGNHWGLKHITKLALEGVIQGDEKGAFRPDDAVSQQDSVIMMIRSLGLEAEALKINADASAIGLDVRSDAKPYLIEAIDKGILDIQEELSVVADKGWGARNASREWIAKLIVRAIGKKDEAKDLSGKPTTFKDNTDISTAALGFVNAAVAHKIVDGFDDGKFKPKDAVTRAQLVTILSRSDKEIPYRPERIVSGYVSEMTSSLVKLTTSDGQQQFTVGIDTVLYSAKSETNKLTVSDIKRLNQVNVIQSAGKAYYIEVISDVPPVETVEGTVDDVIFETMKLNVMVQGQKRSLDLATGVIVVDANGLGFGLRDLTQGSRVEVKRSMITANEKFNQIVVKQFAVNKTADGTITNVDISGKAVTVNEKGIGSVSYPFADTAVLTVKGAIMSGISQLRAGDEIHYQVKAGAVTALDVTVPYVEPVDSGRLIDIKADSAIPYLTIYKGDNKPPLNYLFAKDMEIVVPGIVNPVLKDVLVGDEIKLDLDKKNDVKRITVTSRSIKTKFMKSIISYDDTTHYLLVDEGGKPGVYVLSDKTTFDNDGRSLSLATIGTVLTKGRKVDLTVSQDQNVLNVKVSNGYDGTISQINTTTGEFMLKLADDQLVSLKLISNPAIILANTTNSSILNLTVGEQVTVLLNPSQETVTTVLSKKTTMGRLVNAIANTRQIAVKDNNGTINTYTLADNVPLLIGNRNGYSTSDLPLDEMVQLTFLGNSVTKVYVPDVIRGRVTAVDAAQNKLTVESVSTSQTANVGSKPKVIGTGGTVSDSLSSVKLGDRVEIAADVDGSYRIAVAKADERTVESYDVYSKILVLKRNQLSDQSTFTFHPKAYVHRGNEAYIQNFLLPNDQVRVFVIDNKIVEMEKL